MEEEREKYPIFCIKTGQPLGYTSIAMQYHPSAVYPAWVQTDSESLDKLAKTEPAAYVAYCLGLVDTFWRKEKNRKNRNAIEQARAHHASLIEAFRLVQNFNCASHELTELTASICRFVQYAPLSYRILDRKYLPGRKQAHELAEIGIGNLIAALNRAVSDTVAETIHWQSSVTRDSENRPRHIEGAARGPSQIKGQTVAREHRKNAKQNRMIADILGLMGWGKGQKKQEVTEEEKQKQNETLKNIAARYATPTKKMEAREVREEPETEDLLTQLERAINGSPEIASDDFSDDFSDDDDDEIIVRRIPRTMVESLSKPEPTPVLEPVPQKPSIVQSLLSRLFRA